MSRQLAAISVALGLALAAAPRVETARRPHYGGTLLVEIGAVVNSLDPAVAAANPEEAAAKDQIDELLYDHRNPDGTFSGVAGSGPFRISAWEPGKRVTLAANNDFPGGRPFVDSIEIQMGRAARDRLLDLELNKTDFAEIPPEHARLAAEHGVRVSTSQSDELLALVFVPGRPAADDARVREAIARSIDRAAIVNFILQKEGEPAGGLLPQWSSGTAFLFLTVADASRAKELWSQIAPSSKFVLGYDFADPLEQTVAARIIVNAREAGISLTLEPIRASGPARAVPDALLVRLRMPSSAPRAALGKFIEILAPQAAIDATPLPDPASPEEIYNRERAVVSSFRVVPLVWLPQVYGLSARVRNWKAPAAGGEWPLADVWLEGGTP
ncbi:MAG: ABC transporter substrate-binding protein [Candidatus Acidiferrales bacterium]